MYLLESAFHKATEGEIPEAFGQGKISQVQGQGSFGTNPETPLFYGRIIVLQ